jgi:hypothetical protein
MRRKYNSYSSSLFCWKIIFALKQLVLKEIIIANQLFLCQDMLEWGIGEMGYYFLGIGIDEYQEIGKLSTPVNDVQAIAACLKERYGFKKEDTRLLLNQEASHDKILSALYEYEDPGFAQQNDSLVIYFAGHGRIDEYSQSYYWLGFDASDDLVSKKNWIGAPEIKGILRNIAIRHVLLISDTCFSGNLLEAHRNLEPERNILDAKFIADASTYRSREVLTSGFLEEVADNFVSNHSKLAFFLLEALNDSKSPWIDAMQMFQSLRRGLHDQNPQYGTLPECGHQSGGACVLFANAKVPMRIQAAIHHNANPGFYKRKINYRILATAVACLCGIAGIITPLIIASRSLASPVISQMVIYNGMEVRIEAEGNADIFYTLDGTEPSRWSHKYSEPIKVFSTTEVNAIAVKGIRKDSAVASYLVTFDLPDAAARAKAAAQSFFTDFNVVYGPENAIDGNSATLWRSDKKTRPTWIELAFDGKYKIQQICILWAEHVQSFDVSLSLDEESWEKVIIGEMSNNQAYGDTIDDYVFASLCDKQNFFITPTDARFMRIDIIGTSSPDSDNYFSEASIAEIQAFGERMEDI